jgi:hypothetical protein
LAVGDQQFAVGGAKRPERRHKSNRLQEIGFPLSIRANEELLPSRELEFRKRDVPEMLQRYSTKAHQPVSSIVLGKLMV